jgi:thioredoxin reductase/Fe-S-cluster-containing hydrogenase component 2
MTNPFTRYAHWLHLQYPGGEVETLPRVDEQFRTNVEGVYVVGDLAGVPLLKFSMDGGARVARQIARELKGADADKDAVTNAETEAVDVAILGAGAAGMAAAKECRKQGLSFTVLEAGRRFATVKDFQKEKPIYTYPEEMTPAGDLQATAPVKEALVDELEAQTTDIDIHHAEAERVERVDGRLTVFTEKGSPVEAHCVVVAIGRSGNFRRLGASGEVLGHVHHRLHDPAAHAGHDALVVGGGDSAAEAAIALADAGARVTLSYRRDAFSRPKPRNAERLRELAETDAAGGGRLRLVMESEVEEIREQDARLATPGGEKTVEAQVVFAMIGREAPLDFFRRSGITLRNDWGDTPDSLGGALGSTAWLKKLNWQRIAGFAAFFLFICAVYSWKNGSGLLYEWTKAAGTFPFTLSAWAAVQPQHSLAGVVLTSASSPSFYYTFVYSAIIVVFGWRRVRRRKTQYVAWQTATLAAIQVVPLFLLPEIVLPYLGGNELLPGGLLDALFPTTEWNAHGREYWRAYGFILAWPLSVYNVFTSEPLWWWLGICFVQTFVLIPGMIYYWGKGAYCGWICSCGALAETLGDQHRDKMPHGEGWNKLNMAGQVILGLAFALLFLRVGGWIWPNSWADAAFQAGMYGEYFGVNLSLNYSWLVDVVLAGMVGYGVYFWLSGRFWCRFFCPLAALMHVYAKFSRFRILADKKKCISCNQCTTVCHQGIDVMHYAQQGLPMDDPQCVRCSACVQSCPTGVLEFGQVEPSTGQVIGRDDLVASLVRAQEEAAAGDGAAHGEPMVEGEQHGA